MAINWKQVKTAAKRQDKQQVYGRTASGAPSGADSAQISERSGLDWDAVRANAKQLDQAQAQSQMRNNSYAEAYEKYKKIYAGSQARARQQQRIADTSNRDADTDILTSRRKEQESLFRKYQQAMDAAEGRERQTRRIMDAGDEFGAEPNANAQALRDGWQSSEQRMRQAAARQAAAQDQARGQQRTAYELGRQIEQLETELNDNHFRQTMLDENGQAYYLDENGNKVRSRSTEELNQEIAALRNRQQEVGQDYAATSLAARKQEIMALAYAPEEWTKEQKDAAREILGTQRGAGGLLGQERAVYAFEPYIKALQSGDEKEAAEWSGIYDMLYSRLYSGQTAISHGLMQGLGTVSASEAIGAALGADKYNAAWEAYKKSAQQAQAEHPVLAGAANMAGSLALMGTINGAVGAASGAMLGGKAAGMGKLAQTALSMGQTAITFAAKDAIQNAGAAALGEKSGGDYVRDILVSGAGGAAGTLVSGLTATKMADWLRKNGHMTAFWEFVRQSASAFTFSGTSIAAEAALGSEKKNAGEVVTELGTAFLFSLINGYVGAMRESGMASRAVEQKYKQIEQQFSALSQHLSGKTYKTEEEFTQLIEDLRKNVQSLRQDVSGTYYAGQQKFVNQMTAALDRVDYNLLSMIPGSEAAQAAAGAAQAAEAFQSGLGAAADTKLLEEATEALSGGAAAQPVPTAPSAPTTPMTPEAPAIPERTPAQPETVRPEAMTASAGTEAVFQQYNAVKDAQERAAAQQERDFAKFNEYKDEHEARLAGMRQEAETPKADASQQLNVKEEPKRENGQQGHVISDGGQQRVSGQSTGGAAGTVAGRTGGTKTENAAAQQSRAAAQRQAYARDHALQKVSARELGVRSGTEQRTNTVFLRSQWDSSMRQTAERIKAETGMEVTYVLGPLQVRTSDGRIARTVGVYTGERILVQADNLRVSIDQIADHEAYHSFADERPELNKRIEETILEEFGEKQLQETIERYIAGQRGVIDLPGNGTDDELDAALNALKEEIFADAYAGINAFSAHAEKFRQAARTVTEQDRSGYTAKAARQAQDAQQAAEKYSYAGLRDEAVQAQAEEMERDGRTPEEVWSALGVARTMDGKGWRYEIDDSGMKYNSRGDNHFRDRYPEYIRYQELLNKGNRAVLGLDENELTESERRELEKLKNIWGTAVREGKTRGQMLEDFLKHDELFRRYPQLHDTKLEFRWLGEKENGYYDRRNDIIVLSERIRRKPESTILHEIQHVIQEIDKTPGGSNPEYWNRRMEEGYSRRKNDGRIAKADKEYRRIFSNAPEAFKDKVRAINRARLNRDYDAAEAIVDELYDSEYADLWSQLDMADFERRSERGDELTPYDLYHNTAGEIEARDAAARRKLNAEERRNQMPDTGNADTVFAEGDDYFAMSVKTAADGARYVLVENQMTKAQLSNYQTVADYIADHIGEAYTILESGQKVYIGKDLPNEYTQSQYTKRILQTSKLTAKNKAVSNLGEMIEIASNRRWEKTRHKENKDAPYGMYRYDTTFAFPVQGGARYKAFDAELVIRNASDGKKYLYDIVSIKENTGLALDLNDKARGRRDYDATRSDVSMDSIRRPEQKSQEKFSMIEEPERAPDAAEDRRKKERVYEPTIAKRELRETLLKTFSAKDTAKTARVIDYFADRIFRGGELTQAERDVFFTKMYESGAMTDGISDKPGAAPDIVGDGHLYVSDGARREFGTDWNAFRARAFAAGIYITEDKTDRSADAWTQDLAEAAPDTFEEEGYSQRQKLERVVQAAEEAREQGMSLSEYAQMLGGHDFVSENEILDSMERQMDWALRTFAEKAKLEVNLRKEKDTAVKETREKDAARIAKKAERKTDAMEARIAEKLDAKDAAAEKSRKKLVDAMETRFAEKMEKKDAAVAASREKLVDAMETRFAEKMEKKDAAVAASRKKLVEAMEAHLDERLKKKDAALEKSREKMIDAMEARISEKLQREQGREAKRRALERQARKDMAARQKARKELQQLQQKTLKTLQWLNKNRYRAPEELREQWNEVLGDIDIYAVSAADEMRVSEKYGATWRDLAQMYQDAKANDPNFLPSKELERIVARLDNRKIDEMNIDALNQLYQAAVELRTEFYNRNRVLGETEERLFEEVYADSVREISSAPGGYTGKAADRFMNMEQLSAMNVLERMAGWNPDSTWYSMAKQLEKGERDMQSYSVAAVQMLKDFMEENKQWVMRSDGQGKDAIWYEIKVPELLELGMGDKPVFGDTVTVWMTPAQKVHMYLESRNYDNLRHMAGGRTFADKELYSKGKRQEAFAQGRTIRLAPETVKAIVSDLTAEEKALADALDRYYNGYAKKEINRVSNVLYGFDKAMGKNYAPIFTDSNFVKTDPGVFDATAESVGNLKVRQTSSNPSYNIGAYDAFERNVEQTARFVGMAIPARNWKTLLNWRGRTTSMGKTIDAKWGKETQDYIQKQIAALESGGMNEKDAVTTLADAVFSTYISATFGFNPSIVGKQAGSIPLAMAYLGTENIPSPMQIHKIDRALISKYTKMLDYRLMGYATPETRQLKNHPTPLQSNKITNFLFGGGAITAMDGWAASVLWPWAEKAVRRENPELEVGTQEQIDAGESPFYKKVAERFNDAVARSQSTSDEMHQGRLRKSKNTLARAVTMFKSDSAQVYNAVRQTVGEARYYKRSGADAKTQRRANKRAGEAFLGAIGGYAWAAGVSLLMAVLKGRDKKYRDENGELTAQSVLKGFTEDMLSSIAGAASLGGEELVELIGGLIAGDKFYDIIETQGTEQLNALAEAVYTHINGVRGIVTDGIEILRNGGDLKLYLKRRGNDILGGIRDLAKEAAIYGAGIPANNLEAYILGTVRNISPELATAYEDAMQTANRERLKGLKGEALQTRIGHIFGVRDIEADDETLEAVARLYAAGYTQAAPPDTPSSVSIGDEDRKLNAYQQQVYDTVWSDVVREGLNGLTSSERFRSAGDEQQAKMLKKFYTYAGERAKSALFDDYEPDSYVEKFRAFTDAGGSAADYLAAWVYNSEAEGEKDLNGGTISGSKRRKVMAYIDEMGLTDEQKDLLLTAEGYDPNGTEQWNGMDYAGIEEAVRTGKTGGKNMRQFFSALMKDGVEKSDIKATITMMFKDEYLRAGKQERAALKGRLINAFIALGRTEAQARSDIKRWEDAQAEKEKEAKK